MTDFQPLNDKAPLIRGSFNFDAKNIITLALLLVSVGLFIGWVLDSKGLSNKALQTKIEFSEKTKLANERIALLVMENKALLDANSALRKDIDVLDKKVQQNAKNTQALYANLYRLQQELNEKKYNFVDSSSAAIDHVLPK